MSVLVAVLLPNMLTCTLMNIELYMKEYKRHYNLSFHNLNYEWVQLAIFWCKAKRSLRNPRVIEK